MIRSVTLHEFGADGLCFTVYDAPGAMCIMTVPGLTDPAPTCLEMSDEAHPPVTDEERIPKKLILVIAGNHQQYKIYCRSRNLKDRRDCVYIGHERQLMGVIMGVNKPTFIFTGSWSGRPDIEEVFDVIRMLENTPYQATVHYHPLDPA